MDKNAIKKYAVWARNELISRVSQKALQYGISEKETDYDDVQSINGVVLSSDERNQRRSLIAKIKKDGYSQAMEEASYTWFNRFIALRYMEVNGYIPSRVRVFTDDENAFKPQIIDEAIHLEIDGLDMEKVYEFKEGNKTDELYKYLLITQCNALGKVLPGMFTKISDYTQLLFPDNLLREGSVIEQMISMIPEDDWKDQVQIIGWLYQYYNTELKDKVFADLKKNIKISKENIPVATQQFTPDWIVRYMVENSLGRLWAEGNGKPDDADWKYYLEEAEQEESVKEQLEEIRKEYNGISPEQITFIDPCMGSGHILVYAFDVFMDIYRAYGYTEREATSLIIQKNLYGLDIDERAYQLAYFALMMKARQYDRRFLTRKDDDGNPVVITPNLSDFKDISIDANNLEGELKRFVEQFKNEDTYGSVLEIDSFDIDRINSFVEEFEENFDTIGYKEKLEKMLAVYRTLSQKYDICCTNPPYMGSSGMNTTLSDFVKKNYPNSKSDLFSVFIEHGFDMTKATGYMCMVTMQSWMFLSSFEEMRTKILKQHTITNLMHMENMVMGIAFGTAVTIFNNKSVKGYKGTYNHIKFEDIDKETAIPIEFPVIKNRFAQVSSENFSKIPGSPVAYWVSENFVNVFKNEKLGNIARARSGAKTGKNEIFIKLWWEINENKIYITCSSFKECVDCKKKWFPYNKGGNARQWYGNRELVVDFENGGENIKDYSLKHGTSIDLNAKDVYFKQGITWTALTSSKNTFRFSPDGSAFDSNKGPMLFNNDISLIYYILGYLISPISHFIVKVLNPSLSLQNGDVDNLPIIIDKTNKPIIVKLVQENISLSKIDWDSFETSWDFEKHPFINGEKTIEKSFEKWSVECENRFNTLKANEEELNRIFIDIYGLQDELTPEVDDKDVTVRKADLVRDVKSFISYAVGCMFGRYSIDTNGLAYAGGEWDETKYRTFIPDDDNIIPICDDEYFEDDLTGRFVQFVETVYGKDTLEENLKFIADALGTKGQPRDVIRNYFINNFFADHCKTYQKRPIYWLFESGKKNGFKALIYMHRYQPDTIARIRTDYVHEQQARYRTAIEDINQRILSSSTSERVKLTKTLTRLNDQAEEIRVYEEKIHHLADQMIKIDLDDGVKNNYGIFSDVLAKIK